MLGHLAMFSNRPMQDALGLALLVEDHLVHTVLGPVDAMLAQLVAPVEKLQAVLALDHPLPKGTMQDLLLATLFGDLEGGASHQAELEQLASCIGVSSTRCLQHLHAEVA